MTALLCTTALATPSLAATLPDNPIWTKTVASPMADKATMVCTDNAGNTIVGGWRTKANAAFTAKYNAAGNMLWNKNAPATETPTECVTDASSNIYTVDPVYIKRFNPTTGALVWRSQAVPGDGGVMHYENIAGVTSGALWVSGDYHDGCILARGPCPPDFTAGGAVMKVATSNGTRIATTSIKNADNRPIPDIATNRYGDLFVINGTHRQAGSSEDGWEPAGWPLTCPEPSNFVSKWIASGKPAARVCIDRNLDDPAKLATTYDGDPIVAGTSFGSWGYGRAVRVRKLNYLTLATIWEAQLPLSAGTHVLFSMAADRWTGQNIVASAWNNDLHNPPTTYLFSLSATGVLRWQRQPTRYVQPLMSVASDGTVLAHGLTTGSDTVLSKYAR